MISENIEPSDLKDLEVALIDYDEVKDLIPFFGVYSYNASPAHCPCQHDALLYQGEWRRRVHHSSLLRGRLLW